MPESRIDLSVIHSAKQFIHQIDSPKSKNRKKESYTSLLNQALKYLNTSKNPVQDAEILFQTLRRIEEHPNKKNIETLVKIRLFPYQDQDNFQRKKGFVTSLLSNIDRYNDIMAEFAREDDEDPEVQDDLTDAPTRELEFKIKQKNKELDREIKETLRKTEDEEDTLVEEELIVSLFNLKVKTLENLSLNLKKLAKKINKVDRSDYIAGCQALKKGVHQISKTPNKDERHLLDIFKQRLTS